MSNVRTGASNDFNGIRMGGGAQDSKLAKLDYQDILENRVLSSGGVRHPIKHASIFDRDDNRRVASDAESFELSIEEVTDIQDRIIASSGAVGAQKHPIKVQDKEYALKSVGDDTLVATSSEGATIIAALSASLVLVILTESDQIEALRTVAASWSEGLANQAM